MIYTDENLYKELFAFLKAVNENITSYCPYCGNDIRKQHECYYCEREHLSEDCLRQGKHADDCLLVKHLALLEIDIDTETKDLE